MTNVLSLIATTEILSREIFGNISTADQAVFYVLALASLTVFTWGLVRRVRLWRIGRPSAASTNVGSALWRLGRDVMWQRRLPGRGTASVAHMLLFWGFVVLFAGTTLIAVEHLLALALGREPSNPVFHQGTYFAVYEVILDTFGLALIAGCAYFLGRRFRRPDSLGHNRWDWGILLSLLMIGLTGYLIEGLRIIREQTPNPGYSYVGLGCAHAMSMIGIDSSNVSAVHRVLWWVHALAALSFVAAMPFSRLLHVLAGTLQLATRDERLGRMSLVAIEEVEQTGRVGVERLQDFRRGQLLELDACVSCGRCQDACPAYEAGKPLSPRDVVQDLRALLDTVGSQRLTTAAHRADASARVANVIRDETLWSCTTCTACQDVCPLGISPVEMITDMRRHVVAEGRLRGPPATALQKTARGGNPWGLPMQDRMRWADGLDVPTIEDNPHFDILYWVGCAAAYDRRIQKTARSVVRLLQAADVSFAVLGTKERCTGESARRMGDEFLFQQLAAENISTLKNHDVRKILTHCPHCLNTFRHDYPQLGGQWQVVHHSVFIAQLLDQGLLPRPSGDEATLRSVTYHDPCYLARVGEVTDEPRSLTQIALGPDARLMEMARNRRQTACCGAGGGRMWFDDKANERVGQARVEEALGTGARTVAVSCPFCMIMLGDGLAARDMTVEVRDIAEILADVLIGREPTPA